MDAKVYARTGYFRDKCYIGSDAIPINSVTSFNKKQSCISTFFFGSNTASNA